MCINCNLIAPVQHQIADMLGIPRNTYGIVSNTFDILQDLLVDVLMYEKYDRQEFNDQPYKIENKPEGLKKANLEKDPRFLRTKDLYNYLVENDLFHYLEDIIKEGLHMPVNLRIMNYVLAKYIKTDWVNDDKIVDTFKVPVNLLSSDEDRLRRCIGPTTFIQEELFPEDTIQKYKIFEQPAIDYNIQILPEQIFYTPSPTVPESLNL